MSHENPTSNQSQIPRKVYAPPQMKPLGTIVEITQAVAGAKMDGGSGSESPGAQIGSAMV